MFTVVATILTGSLYVGWFSWSMFDGMIVHYVVFYSVASFVVLYVMSSKIWVWGRTFNLLTQPDFIAKRYGNFKPLNLIFSLAAIIIEAPWVILEFAVLGWLVQSATYGLIPKNLGMVILVLFVMAYIIYGGMKAVAITDVAQGILCSVVIGVGLILVINKLFGGFSALFQQVAVEAPVLLTLDAGGYYDYSYWSSIILTGTLGMFAWASLYNRIFLAKNVVTIKRTCSIGAVFAGFASVLVMALALGAGITPEAVAAGEEAFFVMVEKAFGPVFLALSAVIVIAASKSLIDSVVASHSVIFTENLMKDLFPKYKPNMHQRVLHSRIMIVIYVIVCLIIAAMDLPNLAIIALMLYEGIIQVIPPLVFGVFWRQSNRWAALIGMLAGLGVAFGLSFTDTWPLASWTPGIIGLVVNIIVHIALGFALKPEEGVDEMFEAVSAYKD
jgi:solute:Na+ symporter, SSS family